MSRRNVSWSPRAAPMSRSSASPARCAWATSWRWAAPPPARAPRPAKDCASMEEVRAEIDRIDSGLVDLIGERFAYVDRAWQLKQSPAEARVPWRIQQVIEKVRARAADQGLPPELAEALWRQM